MLLFGADSAGGGYVGAGTELYAAAAQVDLRCFLFSLDRKKTNQYDDNACNMNPANDSI